MSAATIGVTGLVTVGLLSLQNTTAATADDAKREDDSVELALAATTTMTTTTPATTTRTPTGHGHRLEQVDQRQHQQQVHRGQPRPRPSRSDKTRDWTQDGGTRTRDHSANQTNDCSRNDTR